jgi:regulatory protein
VQKSGKQSSPQQIKEKIYAFCAYQERSHREVKKKLFEYGLYGQEVDEMVTALIIDGYLNEERFAKAFAGGKFRIKHWGRVKIEHELEAHGLTKKCIRSGILEINEGDYIETLRKLLLKKSLLLKAEDNFTKRNKLARFAVSKGYESELVWKIVDDIIGR